MDLPLMQTTISPVLERDNTSHQIDAPSAVSAPAIPNNPAAFMDRIKSREVEKGNDIYDESAKVKRNYITSDINP